MDGMEFIAKYKGFFGDGLLMTGCTVGEGKDKINIPNFKIEDGEIILLDDINVEAEMILRGLK